jgi:hypothetical protein
MLSAGQAADSGGKVSKFGEYSGYSEAVYDGWIRTSQYVKVQPGTGNETELAVDLLMPTKDGKVFYEYLDAKGKPVRLPAIWTLYIYHRAFLLGPGVIVALPDMELWAWVKEVLKHGYVVAAVDYRGGGASYGTRHGPFTDVEARDGYDITEWLAAQAWCTGNIGMFGRSYMGITQYTVASLAPPHLKCIFPEMAMFDMCSFVNPGGVFHHEFVYTWGLITQTCDLNLPVFFPPVPPVDNDPDGRRLSEAIFQHLGNANIYGMAATSPFRDSVDAVTGQQLHLALSPSRCIQGIKASRIPVYHWGSWYDIWTRDTLLWHANLDNPQKITMAPGCHLESDHAMLAVEHLRWYDHWLKGIRNGVMAEAPVHYFTLGAKPGNEWRSAETWPPARSMPVSFYFHQGRTGSVGSANDGFLRLIPSWAGKDERTVDYSTTTGLSNRWVNAYGGPFNYPDMRPNDEKGLTYTSQPLPLDVEITGHPVVHLWVTSTAADGDFFVYLEEVDPAGVSRYLTEGTLRASHRARSEPAHDNLELPWHRSFMADLLPMGDKPVELVFDLHPTSNVFDAGNRIRVTVTCADFENNLTPVQNPPPTVTVHRSALQGSHIELPVVLGDCHSVRSPTR